jgi:hypothetical protein
VTVTHTNPDVAQLVTTAGAGQTRILTIEPGQSNTPTAVASGGVAFDPLNPGETTVSASAPGINLLRTEQVTVSAPGITLFSATITVGAGLQYGAFTARLGATLHGGVTMRIRSSDPQVLLIAPDGTTAGTEFIDVFVPNGSTDVNYFVQAVEGTTGTATITASAPGFVNATGTGNVVEPGLQIESLLASVLATGGNDEFIVRVGVPNQFGTGLALAQEVRAGLTLTATITNTNGTAAQLVTLAGGAQSRSVAIPAGSSSSAGTVATGGIAFDPLATGSTTVTATIPGFVTTDAGIVDVEVQAGEEAPVPESLQLAERADPDSRIDHERVGRGAGSDPQELLEARSRTAHLESLLGAPEPVRQHGGVPVGRYVVEEQRRRFPPALDAQVQFRDRLGVSAGLDIRDAAVESREPQIGGLDRGRELRDRVAEAALLERELAGDDPGVRPRDGLAPLVQPARELERAGVLSRRSEHPRGWYQDELV